MSQRHTIPAIAGGQAHEVRVRGLAGLVRGPWSTTASGTGAADTTPPGQPSGVTATGLIRAVALNWTNPTDLDLRSVELWEAATAGGAYAKIGETGGTHFLRSGMPPGGSAWFRLRAVDRSGNLGAWTAPLQGTASFLIASDIQDGILDTAKFAASISPVGLITAGSLPTTKAEEVIFHAPTNQLYRWDPATNAYVRLVRTADLDGQIASAQISSVDADKLIGQVQSAQMADNSVVASKIAAGAITTGKLAVAPSSGNIIWNSCLPFGREGWQVGGPHPPTAWGAVTTHFADNNWRLPGLGTGGFTRAGVIPAGSYADMYWVPDTTAGSWASIPVAAGEWWEFQAQTQRHRCSVELKLGWYDANGNWLDEVQVAMGLGEFSPGFGTSLANYQRLWGKAQAPPGATRMLPFFRMMGTGGWSTPTGHDPYLFVTQALLARSHAGQTEPRPWSPGGITEVDGGMIRTRTIAANRIAASAITATEIAAGAITADKLAANSVTAGKVAAGAINANELAAGAIRAWHIASETVITQAAQIGNGIITNAKIGNLEVDTLKIAGSAVNGIAAGAWGGYHPIGGTETHFIHIGVGDGHGGPFLVHFNMTVQIGLNVFGDQGSYVARIYRNGHLIFAQETNSRFRHIALVDHPGGGWHGYLATIGPGWETYSNFVQHVTLTVQQVKR